MYKIYTKEWRIYHRHLRRIAFAMRITIILLLVAFMHVSAATNAQQITLSERNAPLKSVLNELRQQSGYDFVYTDKLLQRAIPVTIQVKDAAFQAVLQQLFAGQPLDFTVDGKVVVLKERTVRGSTPARPNTILAYPEVRGTVTDSLGQPLAGASIRVLNAKGQRTALQTMTDRHGEFTLRNVPNDARLEISYIGHVTLQIPAAAHIGTVVLQALPSALEEIEVNAGYYKVSDRERTGNIARVTAEEIQDQPVVSPLLSLQGRMAGVEVVQQSGVAGAWTQVQIRGQNSLRADGNYPLYIIDGVPVNSMGVTTISSFAQGLDPLNTLNLTNIESIEVLKDADATSIYGSRGANGVVLITTKRTTGTTTYNVNVYVGAGQISNKLDLMNTEQYLEMRREAYANDGITNYPATAYDVNGTWDQSRYTDWQDELIGSTAGITHIDGNISGGNAQTSFTLGGAYHRENTVFPDDFGYQKFTGNANLSHRSTDNRFRATLALNYGHDNHHLFNNSGIVSAAVWLPPNAPALYDELGHLNWENSTWNNPLAGQLQTQGLITKNLMVSSVLNYEVLSGLDVKVNLGYSDLGMQETDNVPIESYSQAMQPYVQHLSQYRTTKRNSWIVEPQLMYTRHFGKGELNTLVGATFQHSERSIFFATGRGYVDRNLMGNLSAADLVSIEEQADVQYAYSAVFGRLGFNWKQKYFINLTGRRDGSSRFGPGHRFGNFGAVGAAWIFSEEPFFEQTLPFITFGKLRGSFGTTGNDQISDFGYYAIYQPTVGPGGLYPTQLSNPDYGWEVNKKLEAAMDIGLLNERIRFSGAWYRNRSSNQLVGYPLPDIVGFPSVQANMDATVQNTGWELEASSINIRSGNFQWQTAFNISWPRNQLVEYEGIEQSSYANRYRVGAPLNVVLAYEYLGVDPETGLYQVRDVNEDGRYDYDDRTLTIPLGRKYYGGLNNSFQYSGFQLEVLLEFVRQTGRANQFIFSHTPGRGLPLSYGNVFTSSKARWKSPGADIDIQKYTTTTANNRQYTYAQSSNVGYNNDASFLRLKTVSLAYSLPKHRIAYLGLSNCRLYIHAQNLFTWTRFKGFDPQMATVGTTVLPSLRMFTGGIQFQF